MPDFVGKDARVEEVGLLGGVKRFGGIVWRPPPEPSELIEERGLESDGAVEGRFGWVVEDELVRESGEPKSCAWGVRGRPRIREVMSSVEKRLWGGSMTREERLNN